MSYFQSSRPDGRSAARVVADHLGSKVRNGTLRAGDVITHQEIADALGVPVGTHYQAMRSATRLLEKEHSRSLAAVRGQGYRLVEGKGMLEKGRDHQERGQRDIRRAVQVVKAIDLDRLPLAERAQVELVARGMQSLLGIVSLQAERLADHDAQLNMLKAAKIEDSARLSVTETEVQELRARLDKLEGQDG